MEIRPAVTNPTTSQRPMGTECPLTAALNALGGKWNLICLYWLDTGSRRFNELRRLMPEISHKVLAATLRNLEHEGLICRTVHAEVPPRVAYAISRHGETVRPLIQAVRAWGRAHLEWKREDAQTSAPALQTSSRDPDGGSPASVGCSESLPVRAREPTSIENGTGRRQNHDGQVGTKKR
jgi:DNA-binding HxlR family transcriptional regulator